KSRRERKRKRKRERNAAWLARPETNLFGALRCLVARPCGFDRHTQALRPPPGQIAWGHAFGLRATIHLILSVRPPARTQENCMSRASLGPTFEEMLHPTSMDPAVRQRAVAALKSDPLNPVNLYNITWRGPDNGIKYEVLPEALTGVAAP